MGNVAILRLGFIVSNPMRFLDNFGDIEQISVYLSLSEICFFYRHYLVTSWRLTAINLFAEAERDEKRESGGSRIWRFKETVGMERVARRYIGTVSVSNVGSPSDEYCFPGELPEIGRRPFLPFAWLIMSLRFSQQTRILRQSWNWFLSFREI